MPLHFSALRPPVKNFCPPLREIPARPAARKLGFYMEGRAWYTIMTRQKGVLLRFCSFALGAKLVSTCIAEAGEASRSPELR